MTLSLNTSQLDNLPENSPISIVQTPIPITTSVPKRAKSQRKKALAAALATAQEYSEISMEQKKLQVWTIGHRVCWSFLCHVSSVFHWHDLFLPFHSSSDRRHSLKQLGRRVKLLSSWTSETCSLLWRNSSRLWRPDNLTTPSLCLLQVFINSVRYLGSRNSEQGLTSHSS